jgi:hypothetical protein
MCELRSPDMPSATWELQQAAPRQHSDPGTQGGEQAQPQPQRHVAVSVPARMLETAFAGVTRCNLQCAVAAAPPCISCNSWPGGSVRAAAGVLRWAASVSPISTAMLLSECAHVSKRYWMMSADSYMLHPVLGSTRKGNLDLPPSSTAFALKFGPACMLATIGVATGPVSKMRTSSGAVSWSDIFDAIQPR